jgi:hypothetical protein
MNTKTYYQNLAAAGTFLNLVEFVINFFNNNYTGYIVLIANSTKASSLF